MGLFIGNIKNTEDAGFTLENSTLEKDRSYENEYNLKKKRRAKIWGVVFDPSGKELWGKRIYDAKNLNFYPSIGVPIVNSSDTNNIRDLISLGIYSGTTKKFTDTNGDTYSYTTLLEYGVLGVDDFMAETGSDGLPESCPFHIVSSNVSHKTSNQRLYIKFPKFYYCRPQKWEFLVSDKYLPGFLPSPMHYKDGHMYNYAYVSKYSLCMNNSAILSEIWTSGTLCSLSDTSKLTGQYLKYNYTTTTTANSDIYLGSTFSHIYNQALYNNDTSTKLYPLDYASICMIYFLMYIKYNTMCPFAYVPSKINATISSALIHNLPQTEILSTLSKNPTFYNFDKDSTTAANSPNSPPANTASLRQSMATLENALTWINKTANNPLYYVSDFKTPTSANLSMWWEKLYPAGLSKTPDKEKVANIDFICWADSTCSKALVQVLGLPFFIGERLITSGIFSNKKNLCVYDIFKYYQSNNRQSQALFSNSVNINATSDSWNGYEIIADGAIIPGKEIETDGTNITSADLDTPNGIGYCKRIPWAIYPENDEDVESLIYYLNKNDRNSIDTELQKQFSKAISLKSHLTFNHAIIDGNLLNLTSGYVQKTIANLDTNPVKYTKAFVRGLKFSDE